MSDVEISVTGVTETKVVEVQIAPPPGVVEVQSVGPQGPRGLPGFGFDGQDGEDGQSIPGARGDIGPTGPAGPAGSIGRPGLDGQDGEDAVPIPGPPGPAGAAGPAGATGPQGPIGLGLDGQDGNDGMPIVGPAGPTGATGAAGPQGLAGPQGPIGFGLDGEDGLEAMAIPGPAGPAGAAGATGAAGPAGPVGFGIDGEDGADGDSAMASAGRDPMVPLWAAFPTALNTGVAYVDMTDSPDGMMMHVGSGGAGTALRLQLKTMPATPFSVVFKISLVSDSLSSDGAGFFIRDSSGGRLTKFGRQYAVPGGSGSSCIIEHWTNDTTFSAAVLTQTGNNDISWFKFTDDGTNHIFYMSMINGAWTQVYTESRTAFIAAPNQIGFGIEDQNITNYFLLVERYKEN